MMCRNYEARGRKSQTSISACQGTRQRVARRQWRGPSWGKALLVGEPSYETLGGPRHILLKCTRVHWQYYLNLLIVACGIVLLIGGAFLFAS